MDLCVYVQNIMSLTLSPVTVSQDGRDPYLSRRKKDRMNSLHYEAKPYSEKKKNITEEK